MDTQATQDVGSKSVMDTIKEAAISAKDTAVATAKDTVRNLTDAATGLKEAVPIVPEAQYEQPGSESAMWTKPEVIRDSYVGAGKLEGRVALITGGDSGIGRSVAVHYAREGADVYITYLDEHEDALETKKMVEAEGRRCVARASNVRDFQACQEAVEHCISELGRMDILVNNAAVQHYRNKITELKDEDIAATFETNIFGYFYMAMAACKHMPSDAGCCIINTTSITAYMGEGHLLDYSATKGAIVAFTRSLAEQLAGKGIRVNAVAPGPIWTPLIPATFPRAAQLMWSKQVPMGRAGQPSEVGPCYVFLASSDGSYFSGQVLHPNGGTPVNS